MELKGSKTEKNLMEAFAGESQARNKYTYFSSQAKKDGFEQISQIFQETADNEKEHAKIWFKILHGDKVPSTLENLDAAAGGEKFEHTEMYPQFAIDAKEEGFDKIADLFTMVAGIEKEHEERYRILIENIKNESVFKKATKIRWICSNCGYEYSGEQALKICSVCSHPQAYFMEKSLNFK